MRQALTKISFVFSRTNNSFSSAESVGRFLSRGVSVATDDGATGMDDSPKSDKRRKLMSTFRQASVDETRFTPVEKFEPIKFEIGEVEDIEEDETTKILSHNETSQKVSPTVSHNMSLSPKTGKRQSQPEDTEELLPKLNINKSTNSNSNNNNSNGKKSKSSPLRRMGFPLSRAMTLPTQTM
jgi:hypothetical protein